MDRESLLKRREELQKDLATKKAECDKAVSDINALGGAIQDCNHWLEKLEKKDTGENKNTESVKKKEG